MIGATARRTAHREEYPKAEFSDGDSGVRPEFAERDRNFGVRVSESPTVLVFDDDHELLYVPSAPWYGAASPRDATPTTRNGSVSKALRFTTSA
jgi:hypothetical protein